MDLTSLHKRRDALYMRLRYWTLREKFSGPSEKTIAKLGTVKEELDAIRAEIREVYAKEAAEKRAVKDALEVEKKALHAAKESDIQKNKQIAENKKASNQCRTTRNRPAKWRPAPVIFYDASEAQKEWTPSFTVDLGQ